MFNFFEKYDKDSAFHNRLFNRELVDYVAGKLPKNHVFNLGKPCWILLQTGFPNDNLTLLATLLEEKKNKHNFESLDLKNLVRALQSPVAVFSYGSKEKSQNVITDLERDGKKFLIGIHFHQSLFGVEMSQIRGLFNKDNPEWLNWINQGKLLYANINKLQAVVTQQQNNPTDLARYLDLESIISILQTNKNVKHFFVKSDENPQKNHDFSKEASMEAVFEYNADKLTRAVEAGTAPFFENGVPDAVYFADSGKLVPGMNQVLAQVHMRETGAKDFRIVTRAAALRAGSPVNEGAKPLLLCEVDTYDMTSKVFRLFRAEDTAHHEKFPQPLPMPQASVKSIEAKSGEPEKYLSDYLTAVAAGAPFSASRDVKAGFQTNFMKEVKSAPLPFSKTYDIFDDARKLCIAQLHSNYKDTLEQKQERDRKEKEKQRADKSAAKTKGALAHGDEGRNRAGQNG